MAIFVFDFLDLVDAFDIFQVPLLNVMFGLLQFCDLFLINSQYILFLSFELRLINNFVVLLFHYVLHRFLELFP